MQSEKRAWDGKVVRDACGCEFQVQLDDDNGELVLIPQLHRTVTVEELERFELVA